MRLSASTYSRFMYTSRPSGDLPANASVLGSWALWFTMRKLEATSRPTIATSSSSVLGRWEPVPLTIVTFSGGTCESSSKSQGSRRSEGKGRVISGITTATWSSAATSSLSGAEPMGWRTASRKAAASFGNPSSCFVLSTVTFEDGISTLRSPLPYCNWVRTVFNLLLSSLAGVCQVPPNLTGYAWELYPRACKLNFYNHRVDALTPSRKCKTSSTPCRYTRLIYLVRDRSNDANPALRILTQITVRHHVAGAPRGARQPGSKGPTSSVLG